jgi:hypothetical protein
VPLSLAEFTPRRLGEMNDEAWTRYQERAIYNRQKHKTRKPAALVEGEYLYHATSPAALHQIAKSGLLPRDPSWKPYNPKERVPRFDASKDGFLSMATQLAGAGAMGSFVLLRMRIGRDIGQWDFRQIEASTEIRTLIGIPPDRLEYSEDGGRTWSPLTG